MSWLYSKKSPKTAHQIVLPTFDRYVKLGYSVYNYAEDTVTLLSDLKSFAFPDVSQPRFNNNFLDVELTFTTTKNLNEFKWKQLQLNSHLRCSILAGLLPGPFWFSEFLDVHSEAGNAVTGKIFARIAVHVFAHKSQENKLCEFSLKNIKKEIGSRKDCKNISHVVSGLVNGFNAILTFEIEVSNLIEKEDVEASLYLEAKRVFSALTPTNNNNETQSDQQVHWLKKAKFQFYSDRQFSTGSYEDILSQLKTATKGPNLIDNFSVEMTLSPIDDCILTRDLDSDTFNALLHLFAEKSAINEKYQLLMTDPLLIEIPHLQSRVVQFKQLVVDEHFKDTSQILLSAVKSFRKNNQTQSELMMMIETRRLEMEDLLQWFLARQRDLSVFRSLLKDIEIPWITDLEQFNQDDFRGHVQFFAFRTAENVEMITKDKMTEYAILSASEIVRQKLRDNLLNFSAEIKKKKCLAYLTLSPNCHNTGIVSVINNQWETATDDDSIMDHNNHKLTTPTVDLNAENHQSIDTKSAIHQTSVPFCKEQNESNSKSTLDSENLTTNTKNEVKETNSKDQHSFHRKESSKDEDSINVHKKDIKDTIPKPILDVSTKNTDQYSYQTKTEVSTPKTPSDQDDEFVLLDNSSENETSTHSSADYTVAQQTKVETQNISEPLSTPTANLTADDNDKLVAIIETNPTSNYIDISSNSNQTTIAKQFAERCRILEKGEPSIYMLDAHERTSRNENLRWFEILTKPTPPDNLNHQSSSHKVLMLMGATGAGKSTLINGMINYILGVEWNDPFRFKIVKDLKSEDSTEEVNQAHSQTSCVTAYTIRHVEGMKIPYDITIIDTPGYGDTRGIERDREITRQIEQFLVHPQTSKEFSFVNAVCFVANAAESRLTPAQQHIFQSVTSIFGNDVRHNLRLLVTFSDGNKPPVLEAIRQANISGLGDQQVGTIEHHKFNSSALYGPNNYDEQSFQFGFWNLGMQNYKLFFEILATMPDRSWKQTREVILFRDNIAKSQENVFLLLDTYSEKEKQFVSSKLKVNDYRNKLIEAYKCYKQKVDSMKKRVAINDKFFFSYNCQKCEITCKKIHANYDGHYTNPDEYCAKCKCHASAHDRESYEWKSISIPDEEYENKKKTYLIYKESMGSAKLELEKLEAEIFDLEKQIMVLFKDIETNSKCLESSTLSNNTFTVENHVNTIITELKTKKQGDYIYQIKILEDSLKRYLDENVRTNNESKLLKSATTTL